MVLPPKRCGPGARRGFRICLCVIALSGVLLLPRLSRGDQAFPPATDADSPRYPVGRLQLVYVDRNPAFPPATAMEQVTVELGQAADGLVAPRAGFPLVKMRLVDAGRPGRDQFYASAIRSINQQLVYAFNRRDFYAIVVAPMPSDIQRRTGKDLRPKGQTTLHLGIYAGRVKDLRTFLSDQKLPEAKRLDQPQYQWIKDDSPIKPGGVHDLVRKKRLDAYLARLNRQPLRRVDAELSPGREAGGVNLDYMITQEKPWFGYVQYSNTGTPETTKARERFGFTDTELTGRDDIFHLDYITGNFNQVNAVIGSYDVPFHRAGRWRARIAGLWDEYDASVLGFPGNPFHGTQWSTTAELSFNAFQYEDLFLDLIGGARYVNVTARNDLFGTRGDTDFFVPVAGFHVERNSEIMNLLGDVSVEHSFPNVADTSQVEANNLGRPGVDTNFTILRWATSGSFYVEPLLKSPSWRSPQTPTTESLAHEIYLQFAGQYAFQNRLIPTEEQIAGGLYSVRGYPQAVDVGDTVLLGRAEYRLHIPRLFGAHQKPVKVPIVGTFRYAPQYVYTQPDWDLIVRAFADVGQTYVNQPIPGVEQNNTLVGVGLGLELRLFRNLDARVDWGHALHDVNQNLQSQIDAGHNEYNFQVTLLY